MKRRFAFTALSALFSTLFVAGVCGAAKEKSTEGSWTGSAYVSLIDEDSNPFNGVFLSSVVGKGHVTHLGVCEWHAWMTSTDYLTADPSHWNGYGVIITGNGDKLFAQVDFVNDDANAWWSQEATFIGGTGRFEGACGQDTSGGPLLGPFSSGPFDGGSWEGQSSGWIKY